MGILDAWSWYGIGALGIGLVLLLLAVEDVFFQKRHAIRHNFPVVGRLRYLLEMIGPELRQYWVAGDKEETPFNRQERTWVYATAKGENNYFGFGSTEIHDQPGYLIIKNAGFPFPDRQAVSPTDDPTCVPCLKVLGKSRGRRRPFRPMSVVNISAMSFGSLGRRAQSALNRGAMAAGCLHNTGEGGVSPYHKLGGELVWQIGTGYFGARDAEGRFSMETLVREVEQTPAIRAIEIKLSQGAKPGKGGILPGKKVNPVVARTRGLPVWKDVISPNDHSEFDSVDGLIDFVEQVAERTGLPVGIKAAVGKLDFWEELAARMQARGEGPDFIAIDGSEGGTGAAPLTFSDHVALPFKTAFQRVYPLFQAEGIAQEIVFVGSAKLGFPDRAVVALAMGCDLIAVAREPMLAIGCIQAQKCHTGHCPAGVATMNRWLEAGLDIEDKAERVARYIKGFRKELLQLAHTAGYEHPSQFRGTDVEFSLGSSRFETLEEVLGYRKEDVPFSGMAELKPLKN
ncbi:MAG: FMN-binding glutamate synthase family protein [Planctomycetota bacterium]|nr:FMN-binding glutamate synthase family protein [Planctomycetota bacterium]